MSLQPANTSLIRGEAAQNGLDLTNCDREPIHIPGSVQPHGILLAIQEPEMRIVQVSSNVTALLGKTPEQLLGKPMDTLLTPGNFRFWQQQLLLKRLDGNPLYLAPMLIEGTGLWFEGTIHRHDGLLLVQLEPHFESPLERQTLDVYQSARGILTDLQKARSVSEFAGLAALFVREHTGYDRVVVYKFLEDDSGEVIGEAKREDLTTWMGLRYPASDIPKQARALYLKSWLRIIADVGAVVQPLTPELNPVTGAPLDMSFCVLRSVSPIHIQYLKNIGVEASMSLSLIHNDKLWGLVACHHQTPKQISHESRIACEFLAHSVSLQVGAKEENEHRGYFVKLRDDMTQLIRFMSADSPYHDGLLKHRPDVMSLFRAGGTAVVTGDQLNLRGLTPDEKQVRSLLEWLKRQPLDHGLFSTDRLPELYPEAEAFRSRASGLLALQVEEVDLQWLLWFRPEMVQVVNWAGNPQKPVETDPALGPAHLSPRRSFALWREEKYGISEPWWPEELRVAAELRRAVVEVVLKKVQELQRANQDLSRSNVELESFTYVASHDLKEPLRGIHNYAHMLSRSLGEKMNTDERQKLDMMVRLSARMDELIDSLLEYSRVGQLELESEEIDGDEMVGEVVAMLTPRLQEQNVAVRLREPLGRMSGDRVRLGEVFQNLITNALKYNDKAEKWIEIGRNADGYYVRDNGIGIPERYHESIFAIFKRLHGQNAFGGGTGAGLTITRKVIERHGGKMWLESAEGVGTTFHFTLGTPAA